MKRNIARVTRSKAAARAAYDRLSRWYDLLAGSERRLTEMALQKLAAQPGETVLEIGPGTGHALLSLGRTAGPLGTVLGLDLSAGMLSQARRRLSRSGLSNGAHLMCGDGGALPLKSSSVDAILMSFTLELFDTPEMTTVLQECRRVLRSAGRLCVVALSRNNGRAWVLRLYEWAHERFPDWVDCRPIHAEAAIHESGFHTLEVMHGSMWGLPVEIVLGQKGEVE